MKQTLKIRVISAVTAVMTVGSIILTASFAKAASVTTVSDTLSRLKITTSSTHALIATFPSGTWDLDETVTFAYSLAANGNLETTVTTSSAALSTGNVYYAAISGSTLTLTCKQAAGCSGTLSGAITFSGTNASTAGSKIVTIAGTGGITGSFAIPIVDDDQVTVSATVDPTITFDIDVALTDDTNINAPYSINLHTLTSNAVTSSGSYVSSTWIDLSTNATQGAVVTVTSTNAALRSTSKTTDRIESADGAMTVGTANYGLCVMSLGQTTGGPMASSTGYTSGTCAANGSGNTINGFDGTTHEIVNSTSLPVSVGRARIIVNAAISAITPAHDDYTDTLTFIATGTF